MAEPVRSPGLERLGEGLRVVQRRVLHPTVWSRFGGACLFLGMRQQQVLHAQDQRQLRALLTPVAEHTQRGLAALRAAHRAQPPGRG